MTPKLSYRALTLFLTALAVQAQTPAFEVISIKPNNSGSGRTSENTRPGRVTYTNVTVSELIQDAFGIKDFQISGAPGWLTSDKYDITSTTGTSKDLSAIELQPYFRALLADRCQLKFHREKKELQLYSLLVAKSGAKMTVHAGEGDSSSNINNGKDKSAITSTNVTMAHLASLLGANLHMLVVDNTALTGGYDLKLEWTPEPRPGSDISSDSSGPSLFTALQEQLGLKLETTKGPVEIIVIDSIEKPSEN